MPDLNRVDWPMFWIQMLVAVVAITFHEFAHAKLADAAGDPTPRSQGRVTLNPLAHLHPLGTIMMILSSLAGFGIGWGKPVIVNPTKMKNMRWDHFISVLGGPLSNLIQAGVYGLILRLILRQDPGLVLSGNGPSILGLVLIAGLYVNLGMFFFNLIPIGPLDGHWLVGAFLPLEARLKWYQFNRGPGMFIFIILILMPGDSPLNPFTSILYPLVERTSHFILGT